MAEIPPAPAPGSMTVPPLFGWEQVAVVVLVVLAVAVLFFVVTGVRGSAGGRAEWQALLDGRSAVRGTDGDPGPQGSETPSR